MDDMSQATADLYEAFCKYPLKPRIEGCPHCKLREAELSLHVCPLKEMTWQDFGVYPFKAMTTFGEVEDFKHFLPRILELYAVDHKGAHYDVLDVFWKLEYARWDSWPELEVKAVRRFITSWLWSLLDRQRESQTALWELAELQSALVESAFELAGAG